MASETILRQQDVNSLARKLEKFAESLPEHEQGVLGWVLARARASTELELSERDLAAAAGGNTSNVPLNQVLAGAAGLNPGTMDSGDSVSWTHTFNSNE